MQGYLLVNLGTPEKPSTFAVARYLREFLSDYRVIDIPWLARQVLLYAIILPFRSRRSAKAYQAIWQSQGSPLLVYSQRCIVELQKYLSQQAGYQVPVSLGMRYGKPSIATAINGLLAAGVDDIVILSLFPQYASASNGSAMEEVLRVLKKYRIVPKIKMYNAFYDNSSYLDAQAEVIKQSLANTQYDFLLMSYHGVPVRQIDKITKCCDKQSNCPKIDINNKDCYRAQCYHTSNQLAQRLGLPATKWQVSFQSRLGRTPWIGPYTDQLLAKLYQQGIRRLAVCCPSFVADCLETLEEIGMQTKEEWLSLGGEDFYLLPCLNDEPVWIKALAEMLMEN